LACHGYLASYHPLAPTVVTLRRLRRRRLEAALTQQELADRAGISRNALVRLETLRTEPRPPTLRRLAEALDTTPVDLIGPESASSEPSL
jgi:transcriptional regulator with XRE-family HTH domain